MGWIVMFMLWRMRIWSLDLHEALRAYWLIAASRFVEIGRVIEEADRTLSRIFIQKHFNGLSIHEGILGKLDFARYHVRG